MKGKIWKTGRLREWWINLGEYKQRQAAQSNTLEDFFTIVHNEFLGSTTHYTEVAREEFLLMKYCSFERKDLEKHFDRMSRRYYSFNGMDDVNAKHTFLNSLPEDIFFSDVESLFSLDDEYTPQALAVVAYSTSEGDSDPDSEYDSEPEIQTIYLYYT